MLLWAFSLTPAQLLVGLAVVLVVLIIAAASGRILSTPREAAAGQQKTRKSDRVPPRLADPDAPGRPRPRAPSQYPTAA